MKERVTSSLSKTHKTATKMEHNWYQVTMRLNTFINDTKKKTGTNDKYTMRKQEKINRTVMTV